MFLAGISLLREPLIIAFVTRTCKYSPARRRYKIDAVVSKATLKTNFEPTTQREEIAAVSSKNVFLKVHLTNSSIR